MPQDLCPANKAGTERARARHPCQLVGFVIAQRPHPKGHGRAPEQNQALPQRAEDQKAANNLPDAPLNGVELVFLSACETGRGAVRTGDGISRLQQAFLAAGAQALIASIWSV